MFLNVWALAIFKINNTLEEYILVRKYFQETYFCELGLKNYKFRRSYFGNTNQKFNFGEQKIFSWFKTKRLIWPTSIKNYLVLTMFLSRFNFPEETFLRIGSKVAKTCSLKNFWDRNRERQRELLKKTVIFFLTLSFWFFDYFN